MRIKLSLVAVMAIKKNELKLEQKNKLKLVRG